MEDAYTYCLLKAQERNCLLGESTLGLWACQLLHGLMEQDVLSCASHSLKSHMCSQVPKRCVCLGLGKWEPSNPLVLPWLSLTLPK